MRHAVGATQVLMRAFLGRPVSSVRVIELLTDLIKRARRDGVLALESEAKNIDNEFLRSGLQLVIDGTSQDLLREILKTEIEAM
ncbi:MAG: motility protein A, partial [Gemmatimonadales bacterium]|nr:motility protein A [Gemmatimonadales bacterium]